MMTIEEIMAKAEAFHRERGTDVRCPVCNAAEGFFCRDEDGKRIDDPHEERLSGRRSDEGQGSTR